MPVGIHERPGVVLTNDSSHCADERQAANLETTQHELRHKRDEREINRADVVNRVRIVLRYSAVARPGRMPGINPPCLRRLSATSSTLKTIDT